MKKDFSTKEKEAAFNLISARYFVRNFGMMSKADYETLLFHIYIEHLLNNGLCFDDYSISKELGISQTKVRALKTRKELQYPHKGFVWQKAFAEDVKKAVYEENTRSVSIPIDDVNVLTELRYYLETNGWYDTRMLNPKVFNCRLDFFLKLCEKMSGDITLDSETELKLNELKKKGAGEGAIKKLCSGAVEEGLKDLAINASKEVIISVLKLIPFGGVAVSIIDALVKVLERE